MTLLEHGVAEKYIICGSSEAQKSSNYFSLLDLESFKIVDTLSKTRNLTTFEKLGPITKQNDNFCLEIMRLSHAKQ